MSYFSTHANRSEDPFCLGHYKQENPLNLWVFPVIRLNSDTIPLLPWTPLCGHDVTQKCDVTHDVTWLLTAAVLMKNDFGQSESHILLVIKVIFSVLCCCFLSVLQVFWIDKLYIEVKIISCHRNTHLWLLRKRWFYFSNMVNISWNLNQCMKNIRSQVFLEDNKGESSRFTGAQLPAHAGQR